MLLVMLPVFGGTLSGRGSPRRSKSLSAVAGSSALFLNGKQATLDAVATSERKLVIFVDENVMPASVAETLTGKLPIDPVIVPVRVPQGLSCPIS